MSSIVGYLLDIEHKYPALSVQSNDHIKMNKQKKKMNDTKTRNRNTIKEHNARGYWTAYIQYARSRSVRANWI